MNAIREAAARLLDEVADDSVVGAAELHIERITCDVQVGRQSELVTLRVVDGRLQTACTCGTGNCLHLRRVLQFLAAPPAAEPLRQPVSVRPERISAELRVAQERTRGERASALCEPLADLVTAVVRAGVASDRVASVLETLSRVERALPPPLPVGLLRWLGCMREALEQQDVAAAAHALHGAARFAEDLRLPVLDAEAHARVVTWLGVGHVDELQRVSDRRMLELAREWVTGVERHQIERRYLIDLDSGELYREEHVRRQSMSSLGSCPRLIGVSLAEVELGSAPRRLRLLQYTTTPEIDRTSWDALAGWAQRDARAVIAAYQAELQQVGALAEPFVLLVPRALEPGPVPKLVFEHGPSLPVSADDEPGALKYLESLFAAHTPSWLAGRLLMRGGQLMLRPLSAGILEPAGIRHERL